MKKKTKLLSFDTSSTSTGWAFFENGVYVDSGMINLNTPNHKKIYKNNSEMRLRDMCLAIIDILERVKPDIIVVEKLNVGRNMQAMRLLAEIIGVIYGYTIKNDCYLYKIQATEWRSKLGMQSSKTKREEFKQLSIDYVKNNFGKETGDDEADAICAGVGYIKIFTQGE